MGSLATASSCFNCKVKVDEDIIENIRKYQKENNLPENTDMAAYINSFYKDGPIGALTLFADLFNDQDAKNMLRLYHVILQKCLSVIFSNDIISNTEYIERMICNINEYTEDVARYYEIKKEEVKDIHKQEVLNICKKFSEYVRPYIIDHYFNTIMGSDRSVSDVPREKLNFDIDTDDDNLDCIPPLKKLKIDK